MTEGRFIAYYRVSTDKQGQSGLGLDAQRIAVRDYLNSGNWTLVDEVEEIETGTAKRNRPKLAQAIALCRKAKATLIIAKLDRLARNVQFIATLMNSGVDFVAVDFPQANRLTVHILAAVAEHEAEMISLRTRAALQAAKRRGVQLGNRTNPEEALTKGRAIRSALADQQAQNVLAVIHQIQAAGVTTMRGIATALNARGVRTTRGGDWHPESVRRVLERAS